MSQNLIYIERPVAVFYVQAARLKEYRGLIHFSPFDLPDIYRKRQSKGDEMLSTTLLVKAQRYLELESAFKTLEGKEWERVAEERDSCLTYVAYTPAVCMSELWAKQEVLAAHREYTTLVDDLLTASIQNDRISLGIDEVAH